MHARAGARTPRSPCTAFFEGSARSTRSTRISRRPPSASRRWRTRRRRRGASNSSASRRWDSHERRARHPHRDRAACRSSRPKAERQCSVGKWTLSHASSPSWIASVMSRGSTAHASGATQGMRVKCAMCASAALHGRGPGRGRGDSPGRRPCVRRRSSSSTTAAGASGWPRHSPRARRARGGPGMLLQIPQTVPDEPPDHAVKAPGSSVSCATRRSENAEPDADSSVRAGFAISRRPRRSRSRPTSRRSRRPAGAAR